MKYDIVVHSILGLLFLTVFFSLVAAFVYYKRKLGGSANMVKAGALPKILVKLWSIWFILLIFVVGYPIFSDLTDITEKAIFGVTFIILTGSIYYLFKRKDRESSSKQSG